VPIVPEENLRWVSEGCSTVKRGQHVVFLSEGADMTPSTVSAWFVFMRYVRNLHEHRIGWEEPKDPPVGGCSRMIRKL
jgi:hypothetical protein